MLLKIEDLHVEAGGREILGGIDLEIKDGRTCILFGPNGSGKSTLLAAIMGLGHCRITKGRIIYNDADITNMPIDERARLGIGMMMQRPPNLPGVKLKSLVGAVAGECDIVSRANEFRMDKFLDRDINVGFSGGEIKRSELLQLTAQSPQFLLLDEPESGVDLESIGLVGKKVHDLLYGTANCDRDKKKRVSALVITHTGQILDYIGADHAFILIDGKIKCSGRPADLLKDIRERGYKECIQCRMVKM
ncbi:MAG: ABC transporter ATP-binding protein [Methanomassiliicoccaceae archaeon]|jgi:Fe-S cluster assembly ATP-binding protein|nr:ABC transporter ATP-binding protein [Methanomassiliicoccaceae archaeon]